MEPPPGWGDDELTQFFDLTRRNQLATFVHRHGPFRRLRDLDGLWLRVANHLDNPPSWHPTFFFYRAHSAWRTACGMAMAGVVPETYMVLRGCLEFALYGHFIHHKPEMWDIWADRNDSAAAKRAMTSAFTVRAVMDELAAVDAAGAAATQTLYDTCIEIGGHPNPQALFSGITMTETEDAIHFDNTYLMEGDTPPAELAVRSVARVGVCALGIFGSVFGTRYDLLGIWPALQPIKRGL